METPNSSFARVIQAITATVISLALVMVSILAGSQSASAASDKYFYWPILDDVDGSMVGGIGRAQMAPPNTVTRPLVQPSDPSDPGVITYSLASDGEYLYWSEETGGKTVISRAPISNPSAVDKDFITVSEDKGVVYAIAISGRTIYWSASVDEGSGAGQIMKASIDKPDEVEELASDVLAFALAIDSGQLYWINNEDNGDEDESSPTTIGRMSLDDPESLDKNWFNPSHGSMFGLGAKDGYVYWHNSEENSIDRVKASDVTDVTPKFIADATDGGYMAIAIDGNSIYWTSVRVIGDPDDYNFVVSIKSAALANPSNVTTVVEDIGAPTYALVISGGGKPDPKPTPQVKQKQTLRKGVVPKRIKKRGTTVINKRNAITKQGRPMKAKVRVMRSRGEVKCMTVKYGAKRKVTIRTYGQCSFRVRVTYTAPGNAKYYKFAKTKSYRVKR